MSGDGELAIVLHTHMPYVEGFGTWPFGEEWLWEAMACCYLPLVELLESGAALTLSLTPVLCDQLQAPGLQARFERFVREVRAFTHEEDARGLRAAGEQLLARELERSLGEYIQACDRLDRLGGDLLGALLVHARWTSSATHAILPLLADDALLRAQIRTGVRAHRTRTARAWRGGFWLPECAYDPQIDGALIEAGVRCSCIEMSNLHQVGAPEHLRPALCEGGLVLAPIDRQSIALVWSEPGYPAHGLYRDSHRRTIHNRNPWRNDGGPYDHEQAARTAEAHARDFVERVRARLRQHGSGLPGGGLVVFAADTELFGLWWYEGLTWLAAVVRECDRQGLALVALEDAQAMAEPLSAAAIGLDRAPAGSWGHAGSLETWSGSGSRLAAGRPIGDQDAAERATEVAQMALQLRRAERKLLEAGEHASRDALRALLAAQASDWAFMVFNGDAVPYARDRFTGHLERLRRELQGSCVAEESLSDGLALRGIAGCAQMADLLEPPPPALGA